tara:strand:+ start:3329 stop:3949 length:621 start_codon:yes stop_codon:yes gene_type:complete
MPLVIAGLAVGGAAFSYMGSMEQTANANAQARANYLNQEHQARLKVQQQNDQQIQNYQRQLLQNLYIGRAATKQKIRDKQSLNRAAAAQAVSIHEQNRAAFDMLGMTFGSRGISGKSGTALALKRQALRNWSSTMEAHRYNTKQQQEQIGLKYENALARQGSNEYLTNSYIGGQPPQMINGTWSAMAAGFSGGVAGASAGHGFMKD